jgi:hypothetical protein
MAETDALNYGEEIPFSAVDKMFPGAIPAFSSYLRFQSTAEQRKNATKRRGGNAYSEYMVQLQGDWEAALEGGGRSKMTGGGAADFVFRVGDGGELLATVSEEGADGATVFTWDGHNWQMRIDWAGTESLGAPSEIADPDEAYSRISGQIYNGGVIQLVDNEGGSFSAVRNLLKLADQVAVASPHWQNARDLIMQTLRILSAGKRRGRYGNSYSDTTVDKESALYGPLIRALELVDKDLGLRDQVLDQGASILRQMTGTLGTEIEPGDALQKPQESATRKSLEAVADYRQTAMNADQQQALRVCGMCQKEVGAVAAPGRAQSHGWCRRHAYQWFRQSGFEQQAKELMKEPDSYFAPDMLQRQLPAPRTEAEEKEEFAKFSKLLTESDWQFSSKIDLKIGNVYGTPDWAFDYQGQLEVVWEVMFDVREYGIKSIDIVPKKISGSVSLLDDNDEAKEVHEIQWSGGDDWKVGYQFQPREHLSVILDTAEVNLADKSIMLQF